MAYESERSIALQAVLKASRLCQTVRASLVSEETITKKDRSPVTVADFGAQAIISLELKRAFPNDPIMAEEDAATFQAPETTIVKEKVLEHVGVIIPGLGEDEVISAIDFGTHEGGSSGRFWTIDPIDGTKGFLRGEQYAVALALIDDGQVVLGVLGCPNFPIDPKNPEGTRGCLFVAVKNQGARMRPLDEITEIPINVTDIDNPSEASFCESVEAAHSSHSDAAIISQMLGVTAPPIRIDSQCKYAALARGDASIYMRLPTSNEYGEKIWDHAAGWIIVKEAGGEVTDAFGKPLDFSVGRELRSNTGILGTNGKLHREVVDTVIKVLKSK